MRDTLVDERMEDHYREQGLNELPITIDAFNEDDGFTTKHIGKRTSFFFKEGDTWKDALVRKNYSLMSGLGKGFRRGSGIYRSFASHLIVIEHRYGGTEIIECDGFPAILEFFRRYHSYFELISHQIDEEESKTTR
jgi:hypothetical protein